MRFSLPVLATMAVLLPALAAAAGVPKLPALPPNGDYDSKYNTDPVDYCGVTISDSGSTFTAYGYQIPTFRMVDHEDEGSELLCVPLLTVNTSAEPEQLLAISANKAVCAFEGGELGAQGAVIEVGYSKTGVSYAGRVNASNGDGIIVGLLEKAKQTIKYNPTRKKCSQ